MIRNLLMAAGILFLAGGTAFAQGYPPEPPRDYMMAPPPHWEHHGYTWAERRREAWRCDHGDREACGWLHAHG